MGRGGENVMTAPTTRCPRCGGLMQKSDSEVFCAICGFHDWGTTDMSREWIPAATVGQIAKTQPVMRSWIYSGLHRKRRSSREQLVLIQVDYIENVLERGQRHAVAMQVRGWPWDLWPYADSNPSTRPLGYLRRAFEEEKGLPLRDLRDALVHTGDAPLLAGPNSLG